MNKQEAIKHIEEMGEYEHFVDEPISKKAVFNIISRIDEPQKVVIPQFVADWIEYCKPRKTLTEALEAGNALANKTDVWIHNNQETFARAWLDGYEMKKEKRYRVSIADNLVINDTLTKNKDSGIFSFSIGDDTESELFTKAELEQAGFACVFNNNMFEVQEVE